MAKWNSLVFTASGLKLIAKTMVNNQLIFTKAVSSVDDHSADSDETIAKLTDVATVNQSVAVSRVMNISDTLDKVYVTFPTSEVTTSYKMRTVGLYAKLESDATDSLFAVGISTEPDYVAAGAVDGTDANINLSFLINVNSSNDIEVTVTPDGLVTEEEMSDQLLKKADDKAVIHKGDVDGGQNLYIENATLSGYVSNSGALAGPTDILNERTSSLIAVDPSVQYVVQYWPIVPAGQASWIGVSFYDADRNFLSQKEFSGATVTASTEMHVNINLYSVASIQTSDYYRTFTDNVAFIRVSSRIFGRSQLSVESGTLIHEWRPAPEDMATKADAKNALNQANAYADTGLVKKVDVSDTSNWQKSKVVQDDGGFTESVSSSEDVNAKLIDVAPGLSTWYVQIGATNNPTSDSIRGYFLKDPGGYGNGFFQSNAGDVFSVFIIGNSSIKWAKLSALNSKGVPNGSAGTLNNTLATTDLNLLNQPGVYQSTGGVSKWQHAPAALSNGVQFWGFLEVQVAVGVIFQTLNWDDGHVWKSCRRSFAGSPGQWGDWLGLNETVMPC